MKKIEIYDEYIKLSQFLKIADLISSGGEARFFLSENEVIVNGDLEDRRGRKLYKGDTVEVLGSRYIIC
ncbi:MAG: S4 domain-containing protein YaaA [Erysipelotrichaceae bacterium]|nr:S4 domain-containing protein YaaA [Erysipelotrichaceae bacterium]